MEKNASSGEELQRRLAAYLLGVKVGERLPLVRELAHAHQSSIGAISNALNELEQRGAIQLQRRGHLGSFLMSRHVGELWQISEQSPFLIAFPLPNSLLLEGLATGLKSLVAQTGIDVYLTFIRGSNTRLKALRTNKCHMAVMSAFAAKEMTDASEETWLELPPRTYVREHKVFYRPKRTNPAAPLRVGVDWDSFDVYRLVEMEFAGEDIQLMPMSYIQIPRLLVGDHMDAVIWSIDDLQYLLSQNIQARSLSAKVQAAVDWSDTAATLTVRSASESVCAVVSETLRIQELVSIQQKILSGEMVPEY